MFNLSYYIPLILGYLIIIKLIIYLLKAIWTDWLGSSLKCGVKWNGGPDNWAIVTGSTDGIGLSFAKEMAKKGYCLLLMSRTQEKLDRTKELIMNTSSNCQEIRTLAVDFGKRDIYERIIEEINKISGKIDVLINNVGIAYENNYRITELPDPMNYVERLITANMFPATKLTQIVLPKMIENNRGIIINMSSITGIAPTPFLTLYAASKAYVDYLTQGLAVEYENHGIIIQSLMTGHVSTKMMGMLKPDAPMAVTPDDYVENAIRTIGFESSTPGHWKHRMLSILLKLINLLVGIKYTQKIGHIYFNDYKVKEYELKNK